MLWTGLQFSRTKILINFLWDNLNLLMTLLKQKKNCLKTFEKIALELIAALLITLFVYTGVDKLSNLVKFQWSIKAATDYSWIAQVASRSIPILELGTALLLAVPKTRRLGVWMSMILLVIFTLYIGWVLTFAYKIPCHCGGVIKYMTWRQHLVFNLTLFSLTLIAIRLHGKQIRLTQMADIKAEPYTYLKNKK